MYVFFKVPTILTYDNDKFKQLDDWDTAQRQKLKGESAEFLNRISEWNFQRNNRNDF